MMYKGRKEEDDRKHKERLIMSWIDGAHAQADFKKHTLDRWVKKLKSRDDHYYDYYEGKQLWQELKGK